MMSTTKIKAPTLRLRPGAFDRLRMNRYQITQWGHISYPTVLRYYRADPYLAVFNGDVLYTMLTLGLGMTDDEIRNMRLGDLFEIVEVRELSPSLLPLDA